MTTVGILGVVHDDQLRRKHNLTLDLIKELILDFSPDVICGEVLPTSWEHYQRDRDYRGYWGEPPSEYWDLIFPLCEEKKYGFEPIDWVELDVWMDFDPFNGFNKEIRGEYNAELDRWFEKQLTALDSSVLPFNSTEWDNITKQKYLWLEKVNPQSHLFRYTCRHLIMIQRIKNAVKKHSGKRLLCIVGADHNYAVYEGLVSETGIQLIYPLR
ncbi:hypothetical protein FE782_00855 [Paenibacillus antri]|uniref:Uncharacterized protein n=1 Tax=Paenibacillus antri TaxID=2582848 RepID=A0A5R9GK64_9BACL|nr:hypothetical protein [Paenibacillus antri]TLS53934.1 hypothetical protein FE782_00855 [Paenibacillus antri]